MDNLDVVYTLNLDSISPGTIIVLHKQGVLTIQEIIESKRMHSEFGDTLKNYVYEMTSLANAKHTYQKEEYVKLNNMKPGATERMVTWADHVKIYKVG